IKTDNAGSFQAANRASANKFARDLKPMMANALSDLKKDFAQGRQGGYSEKNRELLKGLIARINNLKPNDVVGKGSL
ncbi:MAG: hypothetical protein P8J32_03525, partial [bacterium]|nr:hypothetical protein [bacterium]